MYWKIINRSPIVTLCRLLTSLCVVYSGVILVRWPRASWSHGSESVFFHMINLILYNQMINEVTSLKLYLLKELLPIYHFFFLFKRPSTQIKCMYTAIGEKLLLICVKRNTSREGFRMGCPFSFKKVMSIIGSFRLLRTLLAMKTSTPLECEVTK